jgi:hypothetical protein
MRIHYILDPFTIALSSVKGGSNVQSFSHWTRRFFPAVLLLFACAVTCGAQDHTFRISLTGRSNVSTAEVGKSIDSHCPDMTITADPGKADYLLEAIDTDTEVAVRYQFTLFNHNADRVFSTETRVLDNAVKDVCTFIQRHKQG